MLSRKNKKKFIRLAFFLIIALLYAIWGQQESRAPHFPDLGQKAKLYANQCDDDLCPLFHAAIMEAKSSILLIVYTLSDQKLIKALEERAKNGVKVELVVDKSSPSCHHKKITGVSQEPVDLGGGLMHRKILVVDEEKVYIGSANFTLDSLYLDDNLFAAFASKELAWAISKMKESHPLIGGQRVDFYPLPEQKEHALDHLTLLLDTARESICVAMFTLTHQVLVEKVISAHRRGVRVSVVVDRKSADGASRKSVEMLARAGVPISLHLGGHTFHHKLAIIDQKTAAFGSVNWTQAGFSKNEECLLIIESLSEEQIAKLKALWHAIEATSAKFKCSLSIKASSIYDQSPLRLPQKTLDWKTRVSHNFFMDNRFAA